jgi:hypothetical protein
MHLYFEIQRQLRPNSPRNAMSSSVLDYVLLSLFLRPGQAGDTAARLFSELYFRLSSQRIVPVLVASAAWLTLLVRWIRHGGRGKVTRSSVSRETQ